MRTIKFRGKRVDNNEWVYGYYSSWKHFNGTSYEVIHAIESVQMPKTIVHPETVGQFTGLLDKDGKEIYEGDVLNLLNTHPTWDSTLCQVFFEDGAFHVKVKDIVGRCTLSTHIEQAYKEDVIASFDDYAMLFEVVGNIHDNPELL